MSEEDSMTKFANDIEKLTITKVLQTIDIYHPLGLKLFIETSKIEKE